MQFSRMTVLAALFTAALWSSCESFKTYVDKIPNGAHVPNPCKLRHMWNAVGHEQMEGSRVLNSFGKDFKNNDFKWDEGLCELDSDEDGRPNGEELGDPLCTWTPGQPPDRIVNITHPGICEPIDNPICEDLNDFELCPEEEFECDGAEESRETVVNVMELRMPLTSIPKEVAPLMCMTFDLPLEANHIVAWEPIIDNAYALHFLQVFGCREEDYRILEPTACSLPGGTGTHCQRLMFQWNLGTLGRCYPKDYGIRIGQGGITRFLFQIGWENPLGLQGQTDSSGFRIYYTPNLRPYELGMMTVGQYYLNIPPGREEFIQQGVCGSNCTKRLNSPMYIIEASMVMQCHGVWGKMSIFRDGVEVATPVDHTDYRYHQPISFRFDDPIVVLPGDEIVTTCAYNSVRRKAFMHFDWSSHEEMCAGWLTFYPNETALGRTCLAFGPDYKGCNAYPRPSTGDCVVSEYLGSKFDADLASLRTSCDKFQCGDSCQTAVDQVRQDGCFDDDILPVVLNNIRVWAGDAGEEFSDYMHSCLAYIYGP